MKPAVEGRWKVPPALQEASSRPAVAICTSPAAWLSAGNVAAEAPAAGQAPDVERAGGTDERLLSPPPERCHLPFTPFAVSAALPEALFEPVGEEGDRGSMVARHGVAGGARVAIALWAGS